MLYKMDGLQCSIHCLYSNWGTTPRGFTCRKQSLDPEI